MTDMGDRLDRLLVARGLTISRARARALIEAGKVTVNGIRETKPGRWIREDCPVSLLEADFPWVSRGALKLVTALDHFAIDVRGWVALDVGASTGGFTEVLLDRGVDRVYAVDVGRDQLAPILRRDPRVISLENTDARRLDSNLIPAVPQIVTCDASFIGLEKVLPAALSLADDGTRLVALIKPQFEVGPAKVGKGGIVRDPALAGEVCENIRRWLEQDMGWRVDGVIDSPIMGGDGNREFLIVGRRS